MSSPQLASPLRFYGNGLLGSPDGAVQKVVQAAARLQVKEKPMTTVQFVEPSDVVVAIHDGSGTGGDVAQRSATLRLGELTPYTDEELLDTKDTEVALGRRVHLYRGQLRPSTNLREGRGAFLYADGEVYIGRYQSGRRCGYGVFLCPTGYGYEGYFKDDMPQGLGRELHPCGTLYEGAFDAGLPHGPGMQWSPSTGSLHVGWFERGDRQGPGTVFYENGDAFVGAWEMGRRAGDGRVYYAESGKMYRQTWDKSGCSLDSVFEGQGDGVRPAIPAPHELPAAMFFDVRRLGVLPEQLTELHPLLALLLRIQFAALCVDCSGGVDLAALRAAWLSDVAAANERIVRSPSPNTPPPPPSALEVHTRELLARFEAAAANGVSVDFVEFVAAVAPGLSAAEVRKWTALEATPEMLLRLRGSLGLVSTKATDSFLAISGGRPALSMQQAQSSGMQLVAASVRLSRFAFVRNAAARRARESAAAAAQLSLNDKSDKKQSGAGVAGTSHHHHHHAALQDAHTASMRRPLHQYTISQAREFSMTWRDLVACALPLLSPDDRLRTEAESVPEAALEQYALYFAALVGDGTQYIAVERLKAAQERYRAVAASDVAGVAYRSPQQLTAAAVEGTAPHDTVVHRETLHAFLLRAPAHSRAVGDRAYPLASRAEPDDASGYERMLQPVPGFPHLARWMLLDIPLTLSMARAIDRLRTGFFSLAELLRFTYPNVPCAAGKERLTGAGSAQRIEDAASMCGCCICRFCRPRFTRPRPPNPYLDGGATW